MGAVAAAVAARPRIWGVALVEARRLAPAGWWRRAPFLPVPAPAWTAFRLETMYGDTDAALQPDDVVTWLEWVKRVD